MDKIKGVLSGGKGKKGKGRGRGAAPGAAPPPPVDDDSVSNGGGDDGHLPTIAANYDLPADETDALKLRLRAHLLSPAAATQGGAEPKARDVKELSSAELGALLRKYVDHIDTMYDRTGNLDLVTLMGLTYANGLPIYASNPAVQAHTVHAIKTIMSELAYGSRSEEFKRKTLARLVDAARACQAEQGRVIDAVYGVISGRDSSLKEQVLSVVDAMKDLVMENLVHKLNPDAWKQGDDIPQRQVPHITSSYRVAVGARLGLRGIESAKMDHCKFAVSDGDAARIVTAFERMFVIDELCDLLVNDVNQQAADADRLIDRDLLAKWAGNVDENGGFDSHTVFYDEDNAALYKDVGKPRPENAYQPFLHRVVALQLLRALFFPEPKRFKTAAE